ncbi:MAG: class I SAM-dependent methyltransferase [Candidatus Omnitrophota bacterium]|nr:class I SAM-dependent methyltransferase [Candidatus Omnitrophota bacterium]
MHSEKIFDLSAKPDDYYLRKRPEMLGYIPKTARKILDAGCGAGLFGEEIKQKLNAEVWGIEIDEKAASLARNKIDKLFVGDIYNLLGELPDTYFDCVVFNDSLEHLADPFTVLNKIKAKLTKEGIIVCAIPNMRYFKILKELLIKKQWKYQDSGILDKSHLRFFTQKSIEGMFKALGYEIVTIEGIGPAINNSWELKLLNLITFGQLSDSKYPEFACVVKPI